MLRRIRGFTLVEVLVVGILGALFGLMITQAFSSTSNGAAVLVKRARAQADARDLFNAVERYMRSAQTLGTCYDNSTPASEPITSCGNVGALGFTLNSPNASSVADDDAAASSRYAATATSVTFYAYTTNQLGTATTVTNDPQVLGPPDKVVLAFEATSDPNSFYMTVTITTPTSSSAYTYSSVASGSSGTYRTPTTQFRIGPVTKTGGATPFISYLNKTGGTADPNALPAAFSVKVVQIRATFGTAQLQYKDSFDMDTSIELPAAQAGA